MTFCEKGRSPPIEEDDEQVADFRVKIAKSNGSLSGLATQFQHSITSLQEDSTSRDNVPRLNDTSTPQNVTKGLGRFLAQEYQDPVSLKGGPIYRSFTSPYAHRETGFKAGSSSLDQSSTLRQKNGSEGQENWNTVFPDFGGDLKEETKCLAQDVFTINFDQVQRGFARPHSNDIGTLRDRDSDQADFENTRCLSTIEHGSLSTELEALQPKAYAWIAKYSTEYRDPSAAADQKPILPPKNYSFPHSPSCHSERRIEAGPCRNLCTPHTDTPPSHAHGPLKRDSILPAASGTKNRQASSLIQASSGEKSRNKCIGIYGHEESSITENASKMTSEDSQLEHPFLSQSQTGQQSAKKELDLKSKSDGVEEKVSHDQLIPLSLQEDEASGEHKPDEIEEFSRLLAIKFFGSSAQDDCKVIRRKSLPQDAVIQLQNEVQGQQEMVLAKHPYPLRKSDKDIKKVIKLQTVPLAQDPLLQIDKECTIQAQNEFSMIDENGGSAQRPEPALDESRKTETLKSRVVDDKSAQSSSINLWVLRRLSRHKVPENTLPTRVVARTSRSWGLRRFLQYRKAPNSLQQSRADGKTCVQNIVNNETNSTSETLLVLQSKPEGENLTVRKEQTWYDKARALRDINITNSNEEAKVAREQAKTTKREEQDRKQEKKAQEAAAAKAEKSRQKRLRDCAVCTDTFEKPQLIRPCDHYYCPECLAESFRRALIARPKRVFRCCKRIIPIALAAPQLGPSAVRNYELLALELSLKHPLYCSSAPCNAFIPPDSIHGDAGTCPSCRGPTCRHCRAPAHPGTLCPEDVETERVMNLGRKEGWKQCPVCRHLISRTHGCYSMMCSQCNAMFCYSCGLQTCSGACARNE